MAQTIGGGSSFRAVAEGQMIGHGTSSALADSCDWTPVLHAGAAARGLTMALWPLWPLSTR